MHKPSKTDWFLSSSTISNLKAYKNIYRILDDIELRLPKIDEYLSEPKKGEIAFQEELFHRRLRLPIQEYFARLFFIFKIPPYQLNLNRWWVVYFVRTLGDCWEWPSNIKEIRYMYLFKKNPWETPRLYYLQSKPKTNKVVTDVPSYNKGWKIKWFFMKGN